MSTSPSWSRRSVRGIVAALALALTSCVDAPSAPSGTGATSPLMIAPSFNLVGPDGAAPGTPAQANALENAFDRVDRFRLIVVRQSGDTIYDQIQVVANPGQDQYSLQASVTPTSANEVFLVSIIALEGDTELFRTEGVTVTATPSGTGQTPPEINVTLQYSGPGATATSLQVSPAYAVVSPGGTAGFSATVQDQNGAPIAGVPLGWTMASPGVATVAADGVATGGSDGVAQVVATTPSGLEARGRIYVVGGQLTYVEGGTLKTRAAAGGAATQVPSLGGASQPSWGDGRLFYVSGGSVYESGSGVALASGGWPSLSPDGTKLAVDGGGTVVFVNDDGTNPTAGPTGSTPVWLDDSDIVVAGGSIQSVRADGANRTTVVPGDANLPAPGPGGRIAYVSGGNLRVTGVASVLATGVVGRPSWSDNGMWLAVVDGDGMSIAPADGSAPAVPLPGLSAASDPAFNAGGGGASPPPVSLTGLDPSSPVPGQKVRILGSGFDWIIAANDHVLWPTSSGVQELEILTVLQNAIEVTVPLASVAGQISVTTRNGSGTLDFKPQLGAVEVSALTAWGEGVAGVAVSLRDAGGNEVAHGKTDAQGTLVLTALTPGSYTAVLQAPDGFLLKGDAQRALTVGTTTTTLALDMVAQAKQLTATPDPLVVEVGSSLDVTLVPLDINGNPIVSVESAKWLGGPPTVGAAGTGLKGTITGLAPSSLRGGSLLGMDLDGALLSVPVTVTSYISGTLTLDGAVAAPAGASPAAPGDTAGLTAGSARRAAAAAPAADVTIKLMQGATEVGSTVTDATGQYRFADLLAGTYDVVPQAPAPRTSLPTKRTVTLGTTTPAGQADFNIASQTAQTVELDAGTGTLDAIEATLTVGVTAKDADGNVLVRTPTFVSLNTSIATVDASGKVTAVANGTATIQVTVDSKVATVDITVAQKAVSLVLLQDDNTPELDKVRVLVPDAHDVKWKALDANGYPITYRVPTFSSSNTAVVTIDAAGHADAVGAGVAVVTATMDGASDQVTVDAFKVIGHDVDLNNPADLAELSSGQVGKIDGSLLVSATSLTSLSGLGLETIWLITGNVVITDNTSLVDISALSSLEEVIGDVEVGDNPALMAPPPPVPPVALGHVGGSLYVHDNLSLPNLDAFSKLTAVDGALEIYGNGALSELDGLTALSFIGGDLLLRDNPSLNSLGNLPSLQHLGPEGLIIEGGGQVVGLPSLQTIDGALLVGGGGLEIDPLTEVRLPALTCAGSVDVYSNTDLQTVDLGQLQRVGSCGPAVSPPLADGAASQRSRPPLANPFATRYGSARAQVARGRAAARSVVEARWRSFARDDARIRATAKRLDASLAPAVPADRTGEPRRSPVLAKADALMAAARARIEVLARPLPRPASPAGAQTVSFPQRTGVIDGALSIQGNGALTDVRLGSLQSLTGDLCVSGNSALTSLQLPVLHDMGGGLFTSSNQGLTAFSAPMLTFVDGFVDIGYETTLQTLDLPQLQRVGEYFYVAWDDQLAQLSLPLLQYIGSYVYVAGNGQLLGILMPALNTVLGYFEITGNALLTQLQAASGGPLNINGSLEISSNDALQTVTMPGLASTGSSLEIDNNGSLSGIALATTSALTVDGDFYVHDNDVTGPWTLEVPGLISVTGELWLGYNYGLTTVTLATNATAHVEGNFWVGGDPDIRTLDVSKLQRVGGYLDVQGINDPQSMSFAGLTDVVGDLYLGNNGSPGSFEPDFTSLQHVDGNLTIDANGGLSSLSMPQLEHVGGELYVSSNGEIASFSAPLLDGAVGTALIMNNPLLATFDLRALNHIDPPPVAVASPGPQAAGGGSSIFWLSGNDALTGWHLEALSNVASVLISSNGSLATLPGLPALNPDVELMLWDNGALTDVDGLSSVTQLNWLDLESNPLLTDLSGLGALTSLGTLYISQNSALDRVTALTSLTHVLNGITISSNTNLTMVDFPALTLIGDGGGPSSTLGNLVLSANPSLADVTFGVLTTLNGKLDISQASGLLNLNGFASLLSAVYRVMITNNASLSDISGLGGIGSATASSPAILTGFDFITGNTSIDRCNVDNTLYSMRIHTADELPVPWATAFPGMTETYYCG